MVEYIKISELDEKVALPSPQDLVVIVDNVTMSTFNMKYGTLMGLGIRTQRDVFTLVQDDIDDKYIMLSQTPSDSSEVYLEVKNAPNQTIVLDYAINPLQYKQLTWAGLGLESVLSVGDVLTVTYNIKEVS